MSINLYKADGKHHLIQPRLYDYPRFTTICFCCGATAERAPEKRLHTTQEGAFVPSYSYGVRLIAGKVEGEVALSAGEELHEVALECGNVLTFIFIKKYPGREDYIDATKVEKSTLNTRMYPPEPPHKLVECKQDTPVYMGYWNALSNELGNNYSESFYLQGGNTAERAKQLSTLTWRTIPKGYYLFIVVDSQVEGLTACMEKYKYPLVYNHEKIVNLNYGAVINPRLNLFLYKV